MMVLAEGTKEITPHFANGKNIFPREKMIQRFFFDGICAQCCHLVVNMCNKYSIHVFPYFTDSGLAGLQLAIPGTKIALHHMVISFLIEKCFPHFYAFHQS
jgi:hypothetical protein